MVGVSTGTPHRERRSFARHASQAGDNTFFLGMSTEAFAMMAGVE